MKSIIKIIVIIALLLVIAVVAAGVCFAFSETNLIFGQQPEFGVSSGDIDIPSGSISSGEQSEIKELSYTIPYLGKSFGLDVDIYLKNSIVSDVVEAEGFYTFYLYVDSEIPLCGYLINSDPPYSEFCTIERCEDVFNKFKFTSDNISGGPSFCIENEYDSTFMCVNLRVIDDEFLVE